MPPEQIATLGFYAVMACLPLALNFLASRDDYRRYVDAFFMSGMLCIFWAATNVFGALWDFPVSKQFHPLVDLIGLSVAMAAYMTQRQTWKLVLALLFLAQLGVHAWFWWAWVYSPHGGIGRDYIGALNVLWLAQVVSVASPGGGHVGASLFGHLMRVRRGSAGLARN